jgi:serine/threonine protein kinase
MTTAQLQYCFDMANIIRITATDGSPVEFIDEIIGSGGMKDVYFSPDKSYVVAFFRDKQDFNAKDRLQNITGNYREKIFNSAGGEYWKDLYCWPNKIVEHNGRLGLVCPTYQKQFFFAIGSINNDFLGIKGKEKEGKWYASAKNQNKFLAPEEKGDWFKYFQICIRISRAVKRLHAAGLAHSDLSYKNVLIDPTSGKAAIIDIDGLVVPGKFSPDVLGTPDFIAPEVIATKHLPMSDPNRKLPSIATDRHALAVMIYMYLLYRHPLRGGKVHDLDSNKDEELSMGLKALFTEHPTDKTNRVKVNQLHPAQLPQGDPDKSPYTILGPYLADLFNRAFIDGLHQPNLRPTANEWEDALLKTVDLMQPCQNPKCWHKWFVFDNTTKPRCSFCGTEYKGQLPVLNLYYSPKPTVFKPENYRLMVYDKQLLYMWHVNRFVSANEKTPEDQRKPVGDFHFHNGKWILINRRLPSMYDKDIDKKIETGQAVELTEGKKILLSTEDGGRLIIVQLVNNK